MESVESLFAEKNLHDEAQLQDRKITPAAYIGYPQGDDIYNRDKEDQDIDPRDISVKKIPNERADNPNEIDFSNNYNGDDLDVPGAELDDDNEGIGGEDEENNYYSIGGDNYNELEEDHFD